MRAWLAGLAVLSVCLSAAAGASSRYDPRLRFRTISTPRFDVHFHQGEDAVARRLAAIAEEVAAALDATLGPADGRVQVVLVNQNDLPNGWATPVPYNLIEIGAAGPGGASLIGNTDDWLRLVFTHEYTHIVHLGRSSGWIAGLRRAFGRHPSLFPNLALPLWAVEGMATYEESAQTGRGRVNAGDFRHIVTTAAAASAFEPLDRAGGGLDDWPAGNTPYAYGGLFHRYLADTYGADSLRRLTETTGRRLPYFGSTAFRRVFGRSLGDLWSDFEADTRSRAAGEPGRATPLTHHGFRVSGPRFGAGGRVYYSVANPHGFPAVMTIEPGGEPRAVTTRYLGERVGVATSLLVFDEMEVVANAALQGDLHAVDPDTGRRTRLTRGARAADPDVSPDGRSVVFTSQRDDRRDVLLARLRTVPEPSLDAPRTLASAPGIEFTSPRWSPDGRAIAVERQVRGSMPEIVLVDAATGAVRVVASSATARSVSPAFMPDGRRLLFASDRDGGPFRLFAADLATGAVERLEGTGGSAESPDVSGDGATLAFVGYTPAGYDVYTLPLAGARWTPMPSPPDDPGRPVPPRSPAHGDGPARAYTPRHTVAPRYWTPVGGSDSGETIAGVATSGADALGRHAYAAGVTWAPARARPDWQVSYAYDRWRPTLFLSASDDTDPYRAGEARSREIDAGVVLPWRRVRRAQSIFGAFHAATDTLDCATCDRPVDVRAARRAVRGAYAYTSARGYGYSISREEGWSVVTTSEWIARALGSGGNAGAVVADLRGYRRAGVRHGVLAGRLATAASWGDAAVRREFTATGDGPQRGGFLFGSDAVGLLRGFGDDRRGWHALVANLDYRFPIVRPERGAGTFPAFVRTIHGAVFVDAGHAWNDTFRLQQGRVSAGLEVSADTIFGHTLPLTLTSGVAVRHDGLDQRRGVALFGRIGRAF